MRAWGTARREAGFTLIELVVGMVLALIVLGLLFSGVLGAFQGADRTSQRSTIQRAVVKATDTLTSDLRAAHAVHRHPEFYGSPDSLRQLLLLDPQSGFDMKVGDVLEATPTKLRFYADVDAKNRGIECVVWERSSDLSLRRSVYELGPGEGCNANGAPTSQTQMLPPPSKDAADAAAPIFGYRLLVQPTPNNIDVGACTTQVVAPGATLQGRRLHQLIAVDLDLSSIISKGGDAARQVQSTSVSLSSRQLLTYRYGLGCAS